MRRFSLFPIFTLGVLLAGEALAAQPVSYRTVLTDGNFEVREYPARRMIEMNVVGSDALAFYHGLRIFADPTLPQGKADEQFRLTTPVIVTPAPDGSRSDALTQFRDADAWTVSFEPPSGWSPGKLGYAKPTRISWVDVPATRVAVLRYGKSWERGVDSKRVAKDFMAQVSVRGLKTQGPIMLAQYEFAYTPKVEPCEMMIALKSDGTAHDAKGQ